MQIQGIDIEEKKSYGCNGCGKRHKINKIRIWRSVKREDELIEALTLFKEEKWDSVEMKSEESLKNGMVLITLLGMAQDGGMPQAGCKLDCCAKIQSKPELWRSPVSLGIREEDELHLIEASRMIGKQLMMVENKIPKSIWITHAHLGHIDGLGQFGTESMNTSEVVLYCSEKVSKNIENTPSLKLLLENENVMFGEWGVVNNKNFKITPIEIPHRDELGDNHALMIEGMQNKLLFMPDHDTWDETLECVGFESIKDWLKNLEIDIALIDGTFWNDKEIKHRPQVDVKHPSIEETLERIGMSEKGDPRIVFVHLNHTNPAFNKETKEYKKVIEMGWEIGTEGMEFYL